MSTTAFTQTKDQEATIADLTADAAPATKDSNRDYVVLRKQKQDSPSAPQAWEFLTNVAATSSEQAIRKAAENLESDNPVTFVAIPVRSFVPATVSIKTTKTLILT